MTKELIENLRSVGRLWEDEAADLIERLTIENKNLLLANRDCIDHFNAMKDDLAAAQAQLSGIAEQLKQQCSDPALDFCHRFAVLMECMILSDKPHNCWGEANSLLEQYHLALEDWREANGEPYVSGFGKD